jgi:hypothetical protein
MTLSTDALIKKAYTGTTTTNLAQLIPQIWAPQIETNLRRRAVLEQSLVVNTDLLVPGAGDRVFIPALPDITAADQLTEGTDMAIYALSNSASIPLIPTEYGKTIEITRKALDRIKYDGMSAIVDRLSYAMSIRIEQNIAALYNATAASAFPNSQSPFAGTSLTALPSLYPNAVGTTTPRTSATITAADTFNASMLSTAVAKMQQYDNVPMPDGNYWLFISPDAWQSLIMDTNVRQDLRYAAPERLLNGDQGVLDGVRIILSNYMPGSTGNTQILENTSVPVVKALMVAPRWGAIAYKRRPEIVVDPTLYDMGRRRRFGITADFDIELLHPERALVITSAKQF